MTRKTEKITYNVHERGRQTRGVDRLFHLPALGKMIRGGDVQERVHSGDMMGYLGHWPRLVFGMAMVEGGIHQGKAITLQPAIRTIYLDADDEGNITHQEEFLETDDGGVAWKLYESKAGGFSSAIDAIPNTFPHEPLDVYGFDYVYEPNYHTNRGYTSMLDGVNMAEALASGGGMLALLDAVSSQGNGAAAMLSRMFDSLQGQYSQLMQSYEAALGEIDQLTTQAALRAAAPAAAAALLDSIPMNGQRVTDLERFSTARLEGFAGEVKPAHAKIEHNSNPLLSRWGL